MNPNDPISDEHLNAFVDGQLDADEKSRIFEALNSDDVLSRRACEIRKLGDMVRHAYENPPGERRGRGRSFTRPGAWMQSLAAGVLVAVGAAAGWIGHGHAGPERGEPVRAMYLDKEDGSAFRLTSVDHAATLTDSRRVILHISSSDPDRIRSGLDTAETLLKTYELAHEPIEVEVVTNAGGLDLLRSDVSPYARRVHDMKLQYEQLSFLACRTAIERLRREQGVDVELLPEAVETPSAVEEIMERLRDGWIYIQV